MENMLVLSQTLKRQLNPLNKVKGRQQQKFKPSVNSDNSNRAEVTALVQDVESK
jgi:hypothetical protein